MSDRARDTIEAGASSDQAHDPTGRSCGPRWTTMSDENDLARGVEHLQAAAKDLIRATRSFLDAAERIVDDPGAAVTMAGAIGGLLQAVTGARRGPAAEGASSEATPAEPPVSH